jgi:hypothetical protein
MRSTVRTAIVWVCCLALLLPLFGAAAWMISAYWRERVIFRPAEALILESEVRDGPGRGLNYYAHVRYRYEVDGVEHVADRYRRLDWSSSSTGGPQSIVDRHPPGSRQTAWYDPAHPDQAVLSRELNIVLLAMTLMAACLPFSLLILYHRRQR